MPNLANIVDVNVDICCLWTRELVPNDYRQGFPSLLLESTSGVVTNESNRMITYHAIIIHDMDRVCRRLVSLEPFQCLNLRQRHTQKDYINPQRHLHFKYIYLLFGCICGFPC